MAEQRHVLIVHHEHPIRKELHEIFVAAGYDCLLASDGREGLEVFRRSRPPLIVTQLNLPHRLGMSGVMAGVELLKQVRREDPDAAVIVVSGAPHRETAIECLRLGAHAFLWMPVSVEELLITAERALERRRLLIEHRRHQDRPDAQGGS
jgi:DNA-binding NtrC family response regulator